MNYQQQTLAVMNSLDLVVALYDGMIRFLHRAIANIEAGDVAGRRDAIRRVLDILTYLQARLRTDVGGQPAAALAEFYAAIYAQCVRGSRDASVQLLQQSIRDILNVRDAWKQVSSPNRQVNLSTRTPEGSNGDAVVSQAVVSPRDDSGAPAWSFAESESHRWSA
ncbi:MAG: flagellar export chaperone FliS [Acidobacteriaceae bacterium]